MNYHFGFDSQKKNYKWQNIPFADISVLSEANLTCENSETPNREQLFFFLKKLVAVLITFKLSSGVHNVIQCCTLIVGFISGIAAPQMCSPSKIMKVGFKKQPFKDLEMVLRAYANEETFIQKFQLKPRKNSERLFLPNSTRQKLLRLI